MSTKQWRELAHGYDKVAEYLPLRDALLAAADACDQLADVHQKMHDAAVAENTKLRELLVTAREKLKQFIANPYANGFVSLSQELLAAIDAATKGSSS